MAKRIIGARTALSMLASYSWRKISEQIRAVAFIIAYLIAFQTLILSIPVANALGIAVGIGALVFGLAFFLEGLVLGLMPLGERVGVQLPIMYGVPLLVIFSLLLGIGSTLAEPAIASLRTAGRGVTASDAPLLYLMLTEYIQSLLYAVGAGVGVAVVLGMLRFYFGLSLKPFLFVIIPLLLGLTVYASFDEYLVDIIGLAWDTGAVTTGAVTVPLVLAVGIGVSRATGKDNNQTGGFGVIALASALPVAAVLLLGVTLSPGVETFLAAAGTEIMTESVSDIAEQSSLLSVVSEEAGMGAQAVLPLSIFLLAVLVLLLRTRPRHIDEFILGIVLSLVGMILITTGIRVGLAPLGDEVGRQLPRAFQTETEEISQIVVDPFDETVLFRSIEPDGSTVYFFYLLQNNDIERIRYEVDRHDAERGRYVHPVVSPPLFGPGLTIVGVALVFLFAFGMGFGSTLAEPALSALGHTVEEITVGTVKKTGVVYAVSIGVGIGLLIGVGRIMYDVPISILLIPPYILALLLTYMSEEGFAGISWDCGGVTTGTVTVPLVLAMGLGIGGALDVGDGFGILALSSIFPIISVLIYGITIDRRQQRTIRETEKSSAENDI